MQHLQQSEQVRRIARALMQSVSYRKNLSLNTKHHSAGDNPQSMLGRLLRTGTFWDRGTPHVTHSHSGISHAGHKACPLETIPPLTSKAKAKCEPEDEERGREGEAW